MFHAGVDVDNFNFQFQIYAAVLYDKGIRQLLQEFFGKIFGSVIQYIEIPLGLYHFPTVPYMTVIHSLDAFQGTSLVLGCAWLTSR